MFEYKFKKFDFRGFMDFVLNLVDYYGLGEIRFYPDNKELFDEIQLGHIAPGRNFNNPNGFVWAWRQKQDRVRKVTFDQFSKDNSKKINMTIDLDKSIIKLNTADGISSIKVEEILKNNLSIFEEKNWHRKIEANNYWNFINPFWLLWYLLILAWKHKIISGIIIGLIVTYLSFKFGWTR